MGRGATKRRDWRSLPRQAQASFPPYATQLFTSFLPTLAGAPLRSRSVEPSKQDHAPCAMQTCKQFYFYILDDSGVGSLLLLRSIPNVSVGFEFSSTGRR
eukprot:scaffold75395_cov31-Tisochrysis_lutea.AAC.3